MEKESRKKISKQFSSHFLKPGEFVRGPANRKLYDTCSLLPVFSFFAPVSFFLKKQRNPKYIWGYWSWLEYYIKTSASSWWDNIFGF
mmetsp:Transcript_2386/g.5300  ORF Transcript_2386/g.5300 Transcript_2386/m.5300 type:complete len:87 (+) Transcript_2386:874-1134(+)